MSNQTRGLLREYAIVFNQGLKYLTMTLVELISHEDKRLSDVIKKELRHIYTDFTQVSKRLDDLNKNLMRIANCELRMIIFNVKDSCQYLGSVL